MMQPNFVITTYHNRKSRHRHIVDHIVDELGVDVAVIMAPDWKFLKLTNTEPLSEAQAKHLSLVLAYQQVCQTAIFYDLDEFVIMEDDVMVSNSDEFELPEDFDICYLTRTKHNQTASITEPYNEDFDRIVNNWWETPVTCWSLGFAKRFNYHLMERVKHGETWFGHIDHLLLQLNQGKHYGARQCTAVGLSTEREHAPKGFGFEGSIS